jgi:membrane-associated protein
MKIHLLLTIKELLGWLKPETIIRKGGLTLLVFILFAETGLFVGFFLPGDSLLFVSGLAVSQGWMPINIFIVIFSAIAAAVIGNLVGYYFGYTLGQRLFKKEDSVIFKNKYLDMTEAFYTRYGRSALILGRFVPIIRTFVPILAGAIRLSFGRFLIYNIVGALLWVPSLIFLGYWLGNILWVREHIELIVIAMIIVTIIPVLRTYFKERTAHKARNV